MKKQNLDQNALENSVLALDRGGEITFCHLQVESKILERENKKKRKNVRKKGRKERRKGETGRVLIL